MSKKGDQQKHKGGQGDQQQAHQQQAHMATDQISFYDASLKKQIDMRSARREYRKVTA